MNLKEVKNLILSITSSEASEVKVNFEDVKIVVKSSLDHKVKQTTAPSLLTKPLLVQTNAVPAVPPIKTVLQAEKTTIPNTIITSPLIGTFFLPLLDKSTCMQVGSKINKGDVLCVIESLKLVNELKSEVSGEITKISLKDGSPVEFGQPLFEINSNLS